MEFKRMFRQQKTGKFHPMWILIIVALSAIVAAVMWLPAWIAPYLDNKPDQMPYLTPSSANVIMVNQLVARSANFS